MVAKLAHLGSDGTDMRKRRLLSHLAQFGSFSKQGELLCTQGLTYLLENQDARAAFGAYLSKLMGRTFGPDPWRAIVAASILAGPRSMRSPTKMAVRDEWR